MSDGVDVSWGVGEPGRRWRRWPGCAGSAGDDPQGDSGGALDESAGVVEELVDVLTVGAFGEIGVVELVAAQLRQVPTGLGEGGVGGAEFGQELFAVGVDVLVALGVGGGAQLLLGQVVDRCWCASWVCSVLER